jgi:hypothetical protein
MKKTFKQKWALKIRKAHRYLGIFLGIQFIFWTLSGLYFSWTDINEIRGDYLKKRITKEKFTKLISPTNIDNIEFIESLEIRNINNRPYYFINKKNSLMRGQGSQKMRLQKKKQSL